MKYFIWVFILLGCAANAIAQTDGYTLNTAPWSDKEFEVCPLQRDNDLRAVIFEPEIEEWAYTEKGLITTKLELYEKGIREVVVKNEKQLPAYYLKEQKIGYLDNKNHWVDKSGIQIRNFGQLETISGEKVHPDAKANYEKFVYKANFELEHAAAMKKIHYEAPCTVFSVGHYDKLESDFHYDFGPNNPYQCDANTGLKRSQKFNYSEKTHRPVACCPDGSNYYVKLPDGEIKTYPGHYPIWEVLYPDDKPQHCDWNDLGSLVGYNLIQPIQ